MPSYFVSLGVGIFLITQISSNRHDITVEAATTAGLIFGPLAAIAGFVLTFILLKPKNHESQ